MGLALTVGILADLVKNDPEGAQWVREDLMRINHALQEAGLPPHHEPERIEIWDAEGYGYSGLQALGEVADHAWRK